MKYSEMLEICIDIFYFQKSIYYLFIKFLYHLPTYLLFTTFLTVFSHENHSEKSENISSSEEDNYNKISFYFQEKLD